MSDATSKSSRAVYGIDLGRKSSRVAMVQGEKVAEEFGLTMNATAILLAFDKRERGTVVMEVCGASPWVSRLLTKIGFEAMVVASSSLKHAFGQRRKNDKDDARGLAMMGATCPQLLRRVEHRPEPAQRDLAMVRIRDTLVRQRTQLINEVRGILASLGATLKACSSVSFGKHVHSALSEEDEKLVAPALRQLASLSHEIKGVDRQIAERAESAYPAVKLLSQVNGVGILTAFSYAVTIGDPSRFKKTRSIGSYFGLVPRQYQSGDSNPQLSITKAGDQYMRRLLVQSAHYILGPFGKDSDLRRFGELIAARGGPRAKKRAAVAVARRLAVLLLSLWKTGEVYEPLRNSERRVGQLRGA